MKRNHPGKTFFFILLLLGCAGQGIFPAFTTSVRASEESIQKYRIKIGSLRQEIKSHLDKIRETGKKESGVLDELRQLDTKLRQQQQKLDTLQERLHAQEQLLVLKQRDREQAAMVKENVRRHLEKRLRSFYLMGKTGFLNVAFSTDNLPDLMLFNDSFKRLLNYDQSVIDMYRDTINQLELAEVTHEVEKTLLNNFIEQSEEEKNALNEIRTQKNALLEKIRGEKDLYLQAVNEMRKAEEELAGVLVDLKKQKMDKAMGFARSKGKLPAPVKAPVVRLFKQKSEDDIEDAITNGIVFDTKEDTPVRAIYAGEVIFSGYMRGYGNTIIIDHGLRHYTVTARLDQLLKGEGQEVAAGEKIGVSGGIANLFGKGLYFEIREAAQAMDPLEWLDQTALTIAAAEK